MFTAQTEQSLADHERLHRAVRACDTYLREQNDGKLPRGWLSQADYESWFALQPAQQNTPSLREQLDAHANSWVNVLTASGLKTRGRRPSDARAQCEPHLHGLRAFVIEGQPGRETAEGAPISISVSDFAAYRQANPDCPALSVFRRRYRSWAQALAVVDAHPAHVLDIEVRRQLLSPALREMAKRLGRPPSQAEWELLRDRAFTSGVDAYKAAWGTWNAAVQAVSGLPPSFAAPTRLDDRLVSVAATPAATTNPSTT